MPISRYLNSMYLRLPLIILRLSPPPNGHSLEPRRLEIFMTNHVGCGTLNDRGVIIFRIKQLEQWESAHCFRDVFFS